MGVSQLFGRHMPRLPPKSTPMIIIIIIKIII